MLIWTDVETSGLDAERDVLLEIAMIVTDDKLEEIASNSWVTDQARLRDLTSLHPVVQEMHTKNGLWNESRETDLLLPYVERDALEWLQGFVKKGEAQLAGSTISFDRAFLKRHVPAVEAHLHYRNVDVSTLNEISRRFWPMVYDGRPSADKEPTHRGMDDIRQSIKTLKYYLEVINDWRTISLY